MNQRSHLKTLRLSLLSLCASLGSLTVGCGGGSSSPGDSIKNQAASTPVAVASKFSDMEYIVNPAASWKYAISADSPLGSVSIVPLDANGPLGLIPSGAVLSLQALGYYNYGTNVGAVRGDVSVAFFTADGYSIDVSKTNTLESASRANDCTQTGSDDPFAYDFLVSSAEPTQVVVPDNAASLRLSVDDCFFRDNSQTDDPARVRILVVP